MKLDRERGPTFDQQWALATLFIVAWGETLGGAHRKGVIDAGQQTMLIKREDHPFLSSCRRLSRNFPSSPRRLVRAAHWLVFPSHIP